MNAEIKLQFSNTNDLVDFATALMPLNERVNMAFKDDSLDFHSVEILGTTLHNVIRESAIKNYLLLKMQTMFPKKYFRKLDSSLIVANDAQFCMVDYSRNIEADGFEDGDEADLSEIFKLQRVELFEMFK